MSGELVLLIVLAGLGLAARSWWRSRMVAYHTRKRDWHDAKAWALMRRWL